MPTIAEDLVLLLLDPASGRSTVGGNQLDRAIAGALLLDLAMRRRLTADGEGPRAHLAVEPGRPTGDDLLDEALDRLDGPPRRAGLAIERLARGLRPRVLARLVDREVIGSERRRLLKMIPVTTWPILDAAPVAALRTRLTAVLCDGARPDPRLAGLIGLLHAVKADGVLVSGDRKRARVRGAEISAGGWGGGAALTGQQRALAQVQVAVAAAVAVAVRVGPTGAS